MSQLVQMNFLSIFLRSSSAILVPGMMEKEIQLQKEKQDFLEYVLNVPRYPTVANNKQLLNEVEYDIENYQRRGLCYLPKPKAGVDNRNRGLDNSRYHTKTEFNNCFIIYSKARKKAKSFCLRF